LFPTSLTQCFQMSIAYSAIYLMNGVSRLREGVKRTASQHVGSANSSKRNVRPGCHILEI
jgi:hypothetical protein